MATFINNTPRVEGTTVIINFRLDGGSAAQIASLRCKFSGPGRTPPRIIENCNEGQLYNNGLTIMIIFYTGSSGVVVTELPARKQEYNFTLEDGGEEGLLLERDFRLGVLFYCTSLLGYRFITVC